MDTTLIDLLSKGGTAGILFVAVWFVAKKLAATYEARISALERATEVCEKDRIDLRNLILKGLGVKDGATLSMVSTEPRK